MIIRPRTVSISLIKRRYLKPRMSFTDEFLKQFLADEKGYQGECHFDDLIAQSPASTYLRVNDLFLHWHNSPFQIDSLLFAPRKIHLIDVKNYEGDVYIEGDRWFYFSGRELKNPIPQLQRCESLLRPLLQSLGINLPIESNIVFVNPEFTLFQADRHLPIILPTQVNAFLRKLGSVSLKSYDPSLIESARKLALLHDEDSSFNKTHIPAYTYEQLKKGIPCADCGGLSVYLDGRMLCCKRCGHREDVSAGVLRNVEEHKVLFPERLITVSGMNDWCGLDLVKGRMQRILESQLKMVGKWKTAYYL